jgi:hypothetical protein
MTCTAMPAPLCLHRYACTAMKLCGPSLQSLRSRDRIVNPDAPSNWFVEKVVRIAPNAHKKPR